MGVARVKTLAALLDEICEQEQLKSLQSGEERRF
jgi:hypothetical protein